MATMQELPRSLSEVSSDLPSLLSSLYREHGIFCCCWFLLQGYITRPWFLQSSDWDTSTLTSCTHFVQAAAKASCVRLLTALTRERLIKRAYTSIPNGIHAGELLLLLKPEVSGHMRDGKVDEERFANACSELSNSTKNETVCVVYRQYWTAAFLNYVKTRDTSFDGLPALSEFTPAAFRTHNMPEILSSFQHHARVLHKTELVDMFVLQTFEKFASLWWILMQFNILPNFFDSLLTTTFAGGIPPIRWPNLGRCQKTCRLHQPRPKKREVIW